MSTPRHRNRRVQTAVMVAGLALATLAGATPPVDNDTSMDEGQDLGSNMLDWATNFDTNVGEPMSTGTTPMSTVSGYDLEGNPTSFTAQAVDTPDTTVVLRLTLAMTAPMAGHPTDGIEELVIEQDLNFDGLLDTSVTLPPAGTNYISGVCMDGYITCDPGTWDNCRGWRWRASSAGTLYLEEAEIVGTDPVVGCFCINASCENTEVTSPDSQEQLLQVLGEGIVTAIVTEKPGWQFGLQGNNPPVISYYGAATGRAEMESPTAAGTFIDAETSGFNDQTTAWARNPDTMVSDGETAQSAALADTASPGSLVQDAAAGSEPHTTHGCEEIKTYDTFYKDLSEIYQVLDATWPENFDGGDAVTFQAFRNLQTRDDLTPSGTTLSATLKVLDPTAIISAVLSGTSDSGEVFLDGISQATFAGAFSVDLSAHLLGATAGSEHLLEVVWHHSGGDADALVFSVMAQEYCSNLPILRDTCADYAANPACTIQREEQDTVVTINDGVPTGFIPTATVRRFGSGVCTIAITDVPWQVNRTYHCASTCPDGTCYDYNNAMLTASGPSQDVPAAARGTGTVPDTVSTDAAVYDPATASWVTPSIGIDVSEVARRMPDECLPKCKTREIVANVDINLGVPSDSLRTNTDEVAYTYYECIGPAQDVCPNDASEIIVDDCGCLDEFGTVATKFQALRSMQDDVICSDGIPK